MKLYIKQKVFSLRHRFDIYNFNEEPVYSCEGEISFGKKYHLFDRNGSEVAFIKEQLFSLHSRHFIERDGSEIAEVVKEISIRPRYIIDAFGWTVTGDFLSHEYVIKDSNKTVATISKKWFSWGDTYEIDIDPNADTVNVLCVVLIIDSVLENQAAAAANNCN